MSRVDVGFAEPCEKWEVESRLFPSKIGGKPAWLELSNLPKFEVLQCQSCNRPMVFLCQVYAPFEEDDNNFHRTLFIFVCRTDSCNVNNKNDLVKVFRSSLRRNNKYYSYDPPIETPDSNFSLSNWAKLCALCGCNATKHCSKCKEAMYCCREHQVLDWNDNHKTKCNKNSDASAISSNLSFTEYEIVIEPEEVETKVINEDHEIREYEALASQGKIGTMADVSESDLQSHSSVDTDKIFTQFRKRIAGNSAQVLRYDRGGDPLWIASDPRPINIPACKYCGGPRQFEFQIMPQMLSLLDETCLDWGILAVYTCKNSCTVGDCYKVEFVFKQNVSES